MANKPDHNVIRFDIRLACIWPMIADGDVDLADLIQRIRAAIIETTSGVLEWEPCHSAVRSTGGGIEQPLHDEEITWDLS